MQEASKTPQRNEQKTASLWHSVVTLSKYKAKSQACWNLSIALGLGGRDRWISLNLKPACSQAYQSYIKKGGGGGGCNWVALPLGPFLHSSILHVCLGAGAVLFLLVWFCNMNWDQVGWFLQPCFLTRMTLAILDLLCFQMNFNNFSPFCEIWCWDFLGRLHWLCSRFHINSATSWWQEVLWPSGVLLTPLVSSSFLWRGLLYLLGLVYSWIVCVFFEQMLKTSAGKNSILSIFIIGILKSY